jgi:hypothetical protein
LLAWKAMVRLLMLSGLILLLAAPTASAGVREQILRECQEGRITGSYTPGQLRDARKHIPTDIDEYSDCRDVLSRAALAGGGSGGGSGGGDAPVAPGGLSLAGTTGNLLKPDADDERTALKDAKSDSGDLTIDGDRVIPAAAGLGTGARHELPVSLLVVLILLALCGTAATVPTVRRRVLARRKP